MIASVRKSKWKNVTTGCFILQLFTMTPSPPPPDVPKPDTYNAHHTRLLGWPQFRTKIPHHLFALLFFLDCLWPPDGWASKPALLSKNPPGSSISASELKGSPLDHHKICKVYRQVFCIIATNWSEWTRDLQNWWLKWMHGIWAFNQTTFNP